MARGTPVKGVRLGAERTEMVEKYAQEHELGDFSAALRQIIDLAVLNTLTPGVEHSPMAEITEGQVRQWFVDHKSRFRLERWYAGVLDSLLEE